MSLLVAPWAAAQTYEIFHAFGDAQGNPSGKLLRSPDGVLYGTTQTGGRYGLGSIFSLTPQYPGGYSFTELHAFSGPEGITPWAGLVSGPDGTLWGTTIFGGVNFRGNVFQMDRRGAVTTIHSFNVTDGSGPSGPLTPVPGGFVGTTETGGAHGFGTVFYLSASGALTTLHEFDGTDGMFPRTRLLLSGDGFIYGTTPGGGINAFGTVFRIDLAGNFTSLHSFDRTDGEGPLAGLVEGDDGFLYGTTSEDASGGGTVFRTDRAGNLTTLYFFHNGPAGSPQGDLVQVSPNVFRGTAGGGSAGFGTIFQINAAGEFTVLHSFQADDGSTPQSLTLGTNGELYGTTFVGGSGLLGTVFEFDSGSTLTTLHAFGRTDGAEPTAALIQATDGKLYGTTTLGALNNLGAFYRLDLASQEEIFHTVAEGEGLLFSSLLEASDGNFYGTVSDGGSLGYGAVYRLDPSGNLTLPHSFSGADGFLPQAGVMEASDGKLYGTALRGGPVDRGSVFRLDPDGSNFQGLHGFSGSDGAYPHAGLIQATDGKLYGTTEQGGATDSGTIFRVDTLGNFTSVHSLVASEGTDPFSPLLQASDGNLYSTASAGGANGVGTIFRMSLAGSVAPIFDFDSSAGATPYAGLIQASDTNLYGGTVSGGPGVYGTLFRSSLSGNLSTLYEFHFAGDGEGPVSNLLQASDGNLYGVSQRSGVNDIGLNLNRGVVFRFVLGPISPSILSIFPTSGRAQGVTGVTLNGLHFQFRATATFGNVPAVDVMDADWQTILATSPALMPGTLNDLVVTNPDATTATLLDGWLADFIDVPGSDAFHDFIETIFRHGITVGYGNGFYGINDPVTRAQMAVLILKGEHGSLYAPPPCTGIFVDVECSPTPAFAVDWIEELSHESITAGCTDPVHYCPDQPIPRSQMAVFLLKAKRGSGFTPPPCIGIFVDVPCPATPAFPYSDWIEELWFEEITGGCTYDHYCPNQSVTRGQMAVFLVRTFNLP